MFSANVFFQSSVVGHMRARTFLLCPHLYVWYEPFGFLHVYGNAFVKLAISSSQSDPLM